MWLYLEQFIIVLEHANLSPFHTTSFFTSDLQSIPYFFSCYAWGLTVEFGLSKCTYWTCFAFAVCWRIHLLFWNASLPGNKGSILHNQPKFVIHRLNEHSPPTFPIYMVSTVKQRRVRNQVTFAQDGSNNSCHRSLPQKHNTFRTRRTSSLTNC